VADIFRSGVLALLLLSALFLAGCVQEQTVCNKPYLLVGNSCCLDIDDNRICDKDEAPKEDAPSRASGMVVLSHDIESKDAPAGTQPVENVPDKKEDPSPATTEPAASAGSLRIIYVNSSPAFPTKVLVDGSDIGEAVNGVYPLAGIGQGDHRLEIFLDSASYQDNFSYLGRDVLIKFDPTVRVKGVVLSKAGGILSDIYVYCDGALAGRTDDSGSFEFSVMRGTHIVRLQGPGIYEEDTYEFAQAYSSLTFSLERKYSISVSVIDSGSGDPVTDARIYLDEEMQDKTGEDGRLSIRGVSEGTHVIEASIGGVSVERKVLVAKDEQTIELSLRIQKNVTLKVSDRLSGDPVSGARVSVDGENIGLTAPDGALLLDSSYSGECVVEIIYLNVSTSRSIDLSGAHDVIALKIDAPFDKLIEIKDIETGRKVSGWDILLKDSKLARSGTRTDADGLTLVRNIVPGSYDLYLYSSDQSVNASYPGGVAITADNNPLSVNVDMPDPRYSGAISCNEYGVYNKMGRCNVSVKNVPYQRSMPSSGVELYLFVYTGSNASGDDNYALAGQHLTRLPALSPGEVFSYVFDSLKEFEGDKKEIIVALILADWEYSSPVERSVGGNALSASDLTIFVSRIKEHCSDESSECRQVLDKKIVGELAYIN
jgi:hypothetical protein